MNPDLVNIYIEKLLNEIGELTKTRILLDTQLRYNEILNVQSQNKLKELELQLEKFNKKKLKEVNNSENI